MKNVVRTLIFNEQVSLTLADTTEMVNEGIRLHKLSSNLAEIFGKALSIMTFMSACLKNEKGEISMSLKSEDGGKEIGVSGNQALRLRGFITTEFGFENIGLGTQGSLTIIRDDGYSRPFVGSCALPSSGNIDEAFEEYYRISEQLPTRIATVVELNEAGSCVFAGVVVVQPLPFADVKTLETVETLKLDEILQEIKDKGLEQAAKENFQTDKSVWELKTAIYKCNCSREYLKGVLVSLGERQMRQIIREDGAVRVHCHYCNTDYEFTDEDADNMFKKEE